MNDMKDIINRLCDLERRMAKIEAQPVEQAEKQEPDFWIGYNPSEGGQFLIDADKPSNEQIALYEFEPVYTAPPKREWVGLTDDEVVACWARPDIFSIAHAIEAKLKERNT